MFYADAPTSTYRRSKRVIGRIAAAILGLQVAFAITGAAGAKDFDAFGGSGDRQNADRCPAGQFLNGLTIRSGLWVDQAAIVCVPMANDGSTGAVWHGPGRGGNGGGPPQQITCAPNEIIVGVGLQMTPNRQVRALRFNCAMTKKPGRHDITLGNPLSDRPNCRPSPRSHCNPPDVRQDCPADQAVIGVKINSGAHVNAIGLMCGHRPQVLPPRQ
jgi:hypothetical protein